MRGWLPDFEVHTPRDLADALARLADGTWQALAGGTDIMVLLAAGHLKPARYVNLWGLGELRGIEVRADEIAIGALATYSDVSGHPLLAQEFPMLGIAARVSGAAAIQNRGTLGGNLANASPAADTPPALFAYGASVELVGRRGRRRVPYAEFHTGYKTTLRGPDELIGAIVLPRRPAGAAVPVEFYRKVGTRKAQAIAKVGLAMTLELRDGVVVDCALGLSSVAAVPLLATRTAAALRGRRLDDGLDGVLATLRDEVSPIDDVRSSAAYRRKVAANLLEDVLQAARRGDAPHAGL